MKNGLLILLMILMLTSCSSPDMYNGSPQDLMLEAEDMPGDYIIIEDLSGQKPNSDLIMDSDEPEARDQYLEATGRIDGWEHRFVLVETTQELPGFILNQVVTYETIEGARIALAWPATENREVVDMDRKIGDMMIFSQTTFTAPDESIWMDYRVEFVHNNILGAISTYAPEDIATPVFALDLADRLLENFQTNSLN
jgi:hypothetical protein